jgi:hypothetical protein
MKKLLLSALAIASFGMFSASAQLNITITQADFAQASNTTNIVMVVDTMPSVSVGDPGISQTWDFTGLAPVLIDTNKFTPISGVGIDLEFPNANMKWNSLLGTTYLNSSSQKIEVEGLLASELSILGFSFDLGAETAFSFNNSMTFVEFPSVYNDVYEDTSTFTYALDGSLLDNIVPAGITIDSIRTRHFSIVNSTMDAEGVVTNPGDSSYDVLRQYKVEQRIDSVEVYVTDFATSFLLGVSLGEWSYFEFNGFPNPILDTIYTYSWFANNQDFPVVNIEVDENDNPLRATWIYTNNLMALVKSTTNSSCNIALNGAIDISVIGGTEPFTYMWDNGETAAKAFKLSSGTHSLTISDSMNETYVISAEVEANPDFSVALSTTPMSCNDCDNGSIGVSSAGGDAPYEYNWTNGETTVSIASLSGSTNHSVTVTDKNGCSATASSYISGVNKINAIDVSIYPNPVTNGVLNVVTTENTTVSIYNMIGELITVESVFGNQSIDLDEFTAGLYLVQLKSEKGTVTRKITVE